ncbi:hypothetical protein EVAR_81030_1 [Eumeta japonica]|uniref:Uncharacterized protein n=1 Tax=Eumeta variegata TaxID=151549 RepID=A0A4C1T8D1_EUMVA|nr:hypothetical protein EVAR_81030_1 [Eumeta japonica]
MKTKKYTNIEGCVKVLVVHCPLSPPTIFAPAIGYPIPTQETGNPLVTLLRLRVSRGDGDHFFFSGSYVGVFQSGLPDIQDKQITGLVLYTIFKPIENEHNNTDDRDLEYLDIISDANAALAKSSN